MSRQDKIIFLDKEKQQEELKQPKLGNHLYFWDEGKMVMKIIPEGKTPQEVIDEYYKNKEKREIKN